MARFIDLPDVVVSKHLLPLLELNDVLRLRRVCQWIKPLADDYVRRLSTQRQIKISMNFRQPNSLSALLGLGLTLPATNFAIKNSRDGEQIWDSAHLATFIGLYGEKIRWLKLAHLDFPLTAAALAFFEWLPNLETLELDYIASTVLEEERMGGQLPSTFRGLKRLLGKCIWEREGGNFEDHHQFQMQFLEWIQPSLTSISHWTPSDEYEDDVSEIFEPVRRALIERKDSMLEEYNLNRVYKYSRDDGAIAIDFLLLLEACSEHHVKLLLVDCVLIKWLFDLEPEDRMDFEINCSNAIKSLFGLCEDIYKFELPFLESIEELSEESGGTSSAELYPDYQYLERVKWPSLKELKLDINSVHLQYGHPRTEDLLDFLFVGIQRTELSTLRLRICDQVRAQDPPYPYPSALSIGESCPNLRKLTLTGWLEENDAIRKLWSKLPLLEELEFGKCENLGTRAFLPDSEDEPSIINLNNLRSLTLRFLDLMPGITDNLFMGVFREMRLKEFILVSSRNKQDRPNPVSNVSVAGIESLLGGPFASSIQRFPLQGHLKLRGLSSRGMERLEKQFRSANML